jgi:protein-S-isoprenylcysteine O-methyltransferase Ste14
VFALAAVVGALPRLRGQASVPTAINAPMLIGSLLQVLAAFAMTRAMPTGPLLAPLGAALFTWALQSVPKDAGANTLVTGGAYAWLRHPIYLAFLAILVATGFLISGGMKMILPALLYLGGSELRIASEENELVQKFPEGYARYRSRTRWRYLPGLR